MSASRSYPNAPITEAIIDIRVDLPEGTKVADLKRVHKSEEAQYPVENKNVLFRGQVQFGESMSSSIHRQEIGFLWRTEDGQRLFQARLDGFSANRLRPYDSWKPFSEEARRLWDVFRKEMSPKAVTRIAVRYINRIDIPLPVSDLKDYIPHSPDVPPELPQELTNFLTQMVIPLKEIESTLQLRQAIIGTTEDCVSVAIDIDVYRTAMLPDSENGLWETFEELRVAKNTVFEACITDAARELFR